MDSSPNNLNEASTNELSRPPAAYLTPVRPVRHADVFSQLSAGNHGGDDNIDPLLRRHNSPLNLFSPATSSPFHQATSSPYHTAASSPFNLPPTPLYVFPNAAGDAIDTESLSSSPTKVATEGDSGSESSGSSEDEDASRTPSKRKRRKSRSGRKGKAKRVRPTESNPFHGRITLGGRGNEDNKKGLGEYLFSLSTLCRQFR